MTILAIIIFTLLTGLIYVVVLLLIKFISIFKKKDTKHKTKYRITLLITSFIIAGFTTYFFLFTSPEANYKTAYIEQQQKSYKITLRGKRVYMIHDPISLFLRHTYEDSIQYILPRSEGITTGQELPTEKGNFQLKGSIIIKDKQLLINLYTYNYEDHTLAPSIWNGAYILVRRKQKEMSRQTASTVALAQDSN